MDIEATLVQGREYGQVEDMQRRDLDISGVVKTFASLEEFLQGSPANLTDGVYAIEHGLPTFVKWLNRGSDTTVVTFTAAASRQMTTLPVFSGITSTRQLPANVLMFSDPTMLLDRETTIAWFAGNQYQPELQSDIAKIIDSFRGDGDCILLGGSGGGYSALVQHSKLEHSTALVVNPSTRIHSRPVFESYLRKMWGVAHQRELPDGLVLDVADVFEAPVSGQVFYIQNSFDQNFVKNYFWPFAERLNSGNKVYFRTPFYAKGHVPLSGETIEALLRILVNEKRWNVRREKISRVNLIGRENFVSQLLA